MSVIPKVTDPLKMVTDPVLLSCLEKQNIDKDYVEFYQDYAPISLGKEHSPYAKFYRDLKSGTQFMVVSGLPMVDNLGTKIIPKWSETPTTFTSQNNTFLATVQKITGAVTITAINSQSDGRKMGDILTYQPQLFLDNSEQSRSQFALLSIDPINSNYQGNVLEYNSNIFTRRLRIIEGGILGSWIFDRKPNKIVRIKYNQSGNFRLRLGPFGINDDEELIRPEDFDKLSREQGGYPVIIDDSSTFYPDANSVDGRCRRAGDATHESWANKRINAGVDASPTTTTANLAISSYATTDEWEALCRGVFLFYTAALPPDANITDATFSVYGVLQLDDLGITPSLNVYSSNPASNTNIVAADFNIVNWGTTAFCDTPITYANWKITDPYWNNFVLNVAGIAIISKTSVTKLGLRESIYDAGAATPNWSNTLSSYLGCYTSEQGTGFKPKLVVTYTRPTHVPTLGLVSILGRQINKTSVLKPLGGLSASSKWGIGKTPIQSLDGLLASPVRMGMRKILAPLSGLLSDQTKQTNINRSLKPLFGLLSRQVKGIKRSSEALLGLLSSTIKGISRTFSLIEELRFGSSFPITDNLVLNLPLYLLYGDSFVSEDIYHHPCTVDGAIWTSLGRDFNGDDKVDCSDFSAYNDYIEIWFKITASAQQTLVQFTAGTPNNLIGIDGQNLWIRTGIVQYAFYGDNPLTLGAFYHLVVYHAPVSTEYKVWLNTIEIFPTDSAASGGAYGIDSYIIGGINFGYLVGTIGEIREYQSLSTAEIEQNYLATKWRYTSSAVGATISLIRNFSTLTGFSSLINKVISRIFSKAIGIMSEISREISKIAIIEPLLGLIASTPLTIFEVIRTIIATVGLLAQKSKHLAYQLGAKIVEFFF